jgi:hypothetical protein
MEVKAVVKLGAAVTDGDINKSASCKPVRELT